MKVRGLKYHDLPITLMRLIVALVLCIAIAGQVSAQYIPPFQPAMDINVAGSIYLGDEATYGDVARDAKARSAGPKSDNMVKDVDLTYVADKSRTRINLQALGRRLATNDPVVGAQANEVFASTEVLSAVGGVMDQFGLEKNNVAHTYALYWVVYWGLANKVYDAPSADAMQAVAVQAERGFANSADFAAMDNSQKQATAEELMALTAIMDASSEQAKSDPSLAAQLAKAALVGSRKSGLDLDKMNLTEDGFVPRSKKRSDAGDVIDSDQALASATLAQEDHSLTSTNLVLIAAAGGAGFAGMFLLRKAMGRRG